MENKEKDASHAFLNIIIVYLPVSLNWIVFVDLYSSLSQKKVKWMRGIIKINTEIFEYFFCSNDTCKKSLPTLGLDLPVLRYRLSCIVD